MKLISISKGLFVKVDAEDFEELVSFRWTADRRKNGKTYAYRFDRSSGIPVKIYIHRQIMPEATEIDHRDNDGLNNLRCNLRSVNHSTNMRNIAKRPGATSRFVGVYWSSQSQKWHAQLRAFGKTLALGRFSTEIEAARRRAQAKIIARQLGDVW